jgi:hypothetical protein
MAHGSEANTAIHVRPNSCPTQAKDEEYDLCKTHIWFKDSTNAFAAQIVLGVLSTIPAFFQAIHDAFMKEHVVDSAKILEKGAIEEIKIIFLNMGARDSTSSAQSPITIDLRMSHKDFLKFRNDIADGLHHKPATAAKRNPNNGDDRGYDQRDPQT